MLHDQLLSHPFVTEIEKGTLPLERLRLFVLQDYWLVKHATQLDALTIAKVNDKILQNYLIQNFSSVKREGKNSLFVLGDALGLSKKDFANVTPLAGCMALTNFFYAMIGYGSDIEIVSAILASKEIFTMMCKPIGKGLTNNYHLSTDAIEFFTGHDVVEGKIAPVITYIEKAYASVDDKKKIADAKRLSNETEILFFDAIMQAPLPGNK